ncbi:hypothetical protein C8R46DRAFT_1183854 [Mycena filopes]|nr:hypothetical protein C8R46DRAFT_1183854 [Mycena filopes]
MSENVRPWIKDYLIQVAETVGGNLTAVPLQEKGKKVQICEFLTSGPENEDSVIWALVHDKAFSIPVKFSKEAVAQCNKGRRLTEHTTALVTMKKFKPISARIPLTRNGGISGDSRLALHCESVSMIGGFNEGKWGNPKDLDSDADLREWSQALTKDGGAGNVLKDRKKAREGDNNAPPPAKPSVSPRKPPPFKIITKASKGRNVEPMREHRKLWHDSYQNPLAFMRPSSPPRSATPRRGQLNDLAEDARDMGSSSPSDKYSEASSPISGWSPTPAKARPPKKPKEEHLSPPVPFSPSQKASSSYLTAPTPAQRQRPHIPSPRVRNVARPPPPPPPPSGPPRILVPNSDTSQSQSQSQSQPSQPSQDSQPIPIDKSPRASPSQSAAAQVVTSDPQAVVSQPRTSPRAPKDATMLSDD